METDLSPTLQRVQELRAAGKSHRGIAALLAAEGVPLPPGRAKKWNHVAVRACLQQLEALTAPPAPAAPAVPAPAAGDPPPTLARRRPLKVKIEGPWIQSDSLLWEFLVHAVWDHLTEKTDHTIPIQEALKGLPLARGRRNREHLGEALDRLTATRFRLEDELGSQMLSIYIPLLAARLTEERLAFQFPTALIKMVKNPQQYIRLKELFGARN